jgi:hypothetical protein
MQDKVKAIKFFFEGSGVVNRMLIRMLYRVPTVPV